MAFFVRRNRAARETYGEGRPLPIASPFLPIGPSRPVPARPGPARGDGRPVWRRSRHRRPAAADAFQFSGRLVKFRRHAPRRSTHRLANGGAATAAPFIRAGRRGAAGVRQLARGAVRAHVTGGTRMTCTEHSRGADPNLTHSEAAAAPLPLANAHPDPAGSG